MKSILDFNDEHLEKIMKEEMQAFSEDPWKAYVRALTKVWLFFYETDEKQLDDLGIQEKLVELHQQIWTQLLQKDEAQMSKLDKMLVEQKQKFYTEDNIKD